MMWNEGVCIPYILFGLLVSPVELVQHKSIKLDPPSQTALTGRGRSSLIELTLTPHKGVCF